MMDYWNWMFIILILMNHEAVSGIKCQVSDLKINCSSSRSVKFQWTTHITSWKGECNQYFRITSIENKTNIATEYWAELGNNNYTVKGLKEDQYYIFKFDRYPAPSKYPPVQENNRVRYGSTHETGKAQGLTVSSILPTSAYITWAINGQDKGCVQMYKLKVCQEQRCIEYDLPAYKFNGYYDNYHIEYHDYFFQHLTELEPCSDYQAIVTAVDLDGMRSSQFISTSFTTGNQAPGVVGDIGVTKVTPNSLTVMWSEPTSAPRCTQGYRLVLSRDPEFKQKIYEITVSNNRTNTFTGLNNCTLYHIYVIALNTISSLEIKSTSSFTSVISNATVKNLTIEIVSEDRIKVSWIRFKPWLGCVLNFKVDIVSGKFHRNISTYNTYLEIMELEPCTTYNIYVTVLFWGELSSQQSASITARTPPRGNLLNEPVQHIQVQNKSDRSLTVSWQGPKFGMNCVDAYIVYIENSTRNTVSHELTNHTTFEFMNLKQCEVYYVHVRPNYYGTTSRASTLQQLGDSLLVTNTTAQDNVVVELRMKTGWDSLQLAWTLPEIYLNCVSEYIVKVCSPSDCLASVTVHDMSYSVSDLSVCTLYTASVVVKLSETRLSSRKATVSQLTKSAEPKKSSLFYEVNVTTNSVEFEWRVLNMPSSACARKFVISTLSTNGSIIAKKELDYTHRNYTVLDLKACQSYSFKLKLVDENGSSTVEYNDVKVVTQASDHMTVRKLELSRVSLNSFHLNWFLSEESSACVSGYQVTFITTDSRPRTMGTKTPDTHYTWSGGSICGLDSVSVQILSKGEPVGVPTTIDIRRRYEDVKFLSLKVNKIASRSVEVLLTSASFICVTHYNVSWYNPSSPVITSPLTIFNRIVMTSNLLPCTEYMALVQPLNDRFKLQAISHNVTTAYEEPTLTRKIGAIPRGFNISWQITKEKSRRCLHYIRISARSKDSHHEVNVSSSSSVVIGNLVPCRTYNITTQVVGIGGQRSKKVSGSKSVSPQVLPAPGEATIIQITKKNATVKWKIDTSGSDCRFTDFRVTCEPSAGRVSRRSLTSPITVTINGLAPFTQYKCRGVVVNNAGPSSFSEVTFSTSEGVPSQPRNVTVTAISSSVVRVRWGPPDQKGGILNNYTVVLQNGTLRYKVAPGCQLPTLQTLQVVVNRTTMTAVITELPADMQFQATVAAATEKGGSGPPSAPVTSATLTGVSEPVRNMSVTVTQNFTKLWWLPPCNTAGPLTQFLVQLNGSTILYHDLQQEKDLNGSYSDIYNNSLLKAESSYEVTIIPVGYNGTYGQPKSEIFTVPPRIPAEPDKDKFKSLPPVESSSRSAVVTIHRDTFPNTEGNVRYFAILVAESFPHGPSHGWLTNGTQSTLSTWAEARQSRPIPPYQARPPWPNPFQSSSLEELEVDVGSQKCSETDYEKYCDGPLESGTAYELRIRAFTATGYRDSESIKFQTEHPTAAFATVVIFIILAIAIISVASFIVWRRWSDEGKNTKIKKESKLKKNKTFDLFEGLTIKQFLEHAENVLSLPGLLKTEFNILENENHQYPQVTAKLEHNKGKNRYGNISPYDQTRVILEGDHVNDYINASHVKLQEAKSVNYLACQAPKATTCAEFWKMIFQFRVNIIVMLCMPVEKEKEKCFIYYPRPTEVVRYDDIAIYCRKEEEFSDYIVRSIVADKGDVTVEVKQFHFIGWPDFGVPESPDVMVKFVDAVQQVSRGKTHYLAVHCSAGVGRTGTFIALDALMRLIRHKWNCTFNILDIVHKMRQQRCKMVQTEDQYKYIYECMKYALENHRSTFVKVRMYLYKRSKKASRSGESDSKELLELEDLSSPQTEAT